MIPEAVAVMLVVVLFVALITFFVVGGFLVRGQRWRRGKDHKGGRLRHLPWQ